MEEGIVTLSDTNMQHFSRGTGEAILRIPGSTFTVSYLKGLADSLASAGFQVVGVNLRGTGKSRGSSDGVTLQTKADDIAGW
jgi:alpha-beta hydrolase superfamily lysophospholipase